MLISKRITEDGVLDNEPCKVQQVIVTPTAGNVTNIALHDGTNANAPTLVTVRTASGVTKQVRLDGGLEASSGLYANVGANVTEAIVIYERG